jgi:hypothetical protein
MIRNLKTLGIVLMAVFAISATAASAASAESQGTLTSDGLVSLTGTDSTLFQITFNANQRYYCDTHYLIGNVDTTPHQPLSTPEKTFTIVPEFSDCEAVLNGQPETPATFTMNGCDFVLGIGKGESGVYGTTLQLACPTGKEIEFHMYSSEAHTTTICTFKLSAQSGITGATVSNSGEESVTLNGTFSGIHETRTGILCGGSSTSNSVQLDIDALITGYNEAEEPTAISLTE